MKERRANERWNDEVEGLQVLVLGVSELWNEDRYEQTEVLAALSEVLLHVRLHVVQRSVQQRDRHPIGRHVQ